jgi:excisionase family DNA binding protein
VQRFLPLLLANHYSSVLHADRLQPTLNDYGCLSLSVTTMSTEPWVTAEQVSLHLGVAKDTVYRWRERKALPAHKIGRLWKFQLSEVDEWVRAGGADEHLNSGNEQ